MAVSAVRIWPEAKANKEPHRIFQQGLKYVLYCFHLFLFLRACAPGLKLYECWPINCCVRIFLIDDALLFQPAFSSAETFEFGHSVCAFCPPPPAHSRIRQKQLVMACGKGGSLLITFFQTGHRSWILTGRRRRRTAPA